MTMASPPDRRAIGVIGAFVEGWRRVRGALEMWVSLLALTIVVVVPLGTVVNALVVVAPANEAAVYAAITRSIAGWTMEVTGATVAAGANLIIGQSNLIVIGLLASYFGVWTFLWGGVLDRLARNRPVGGAAFFAACGVYFPRFLRLAVILGAAYWALFRLARAVHLPTALTTESFTSSAGWFVGLLVVVLFALAVIEDFAMVRAVVEDRLSMVGALVASARFVRRRPIAVAGLYLLNFGTLAVFVTVWRSLPALPNSVAFAALVALLFARLGIRLAWAAGEIVLFQQALAHLEYTAAPLPVWPDSPAAEAIENLARESRRDER